MKLQSEKKWYQFWKRDNVSEVNSVVTQDDHIHEFNTSLESAYINMLCGSSESPYGNSGCFVPADQKHAIGVAVNSVPYNLVGHDEIEGAETVVVSEIDGGAVLAKQGSLVDDLILSALGVQN